MPTTNALRKAAGRVSQSTRDSFSFDGPKRLGIQYARMVCNQLTQTPLKEKSTPPSLSLYLDVAIVEGAPIRRAWERAIGT